MQFDLDAIGEMVAWLVDHDVPARHQEQSLATLEEEAARICQGLLSEKRQNTRGCKQEGFDHTFPSTARISTLRLERPMSIYLMFGA